jgi:hypothetical protein
LQFQSITQATKCQSASAQHCMLTSTHTQLPATYDARVADVDPALEAEQRGDLAALAQPHCCHRPAPPTCALPLRVLNSRTQTQSVSQSVHCKNSGDAPRTGRILLPSSRYGQNIRIAIGKYCLLNTCISLLLFKKERRNCICALDTNQCWISPALRFHVMNFALAGRSSVVCEIGCKYLTQ